MKTTIPQELFCFSCTLWRPIALFCAMCLFFVADVNAQLIYGWGSNSFGELGTGASSAPVTTPSEAEYGANLVVAVMLLTDILREDEAVHLLAGGGSSGVLIKDDETDLSHVLLWGDNYYGQLGDGTTNNIYAPWLFISNQNVRRFSMGFGHSTYLVKDAIPTVERRIFGMGNNYYGMLGNGNNDNQLAPVLAGSSIDWKHVYAGGEHTIAIKEDGSIWGTGSNYHGQIGDGTNFNDYNTFQLIDNGAWMRAAAGVNHTVAIKTDGSLYAWGYNASGQLGDGTTDSRNVPTLIDDGTGTGGKWVKVAAGQHNLGIKEDGSLWGWGTNSDGQVGLGHTNNQLTPVQIGTMTNWVDVAVGYWHSMALTDDGEVYAWGNNYDGQVGNGTMTDVFVPTRVPVPVFKHSTETPKWVAIAAGKTHSIAMVDTTGSNSVGMDMANVKTRVNIWPNPSQGKFAIEADAATITEIKIVDALGRLVHEMNGLNTLALTVNDLDLTAGIYFLQIGTAKGTVNKKLIIE